MNPDHKQILTKSFNQRDVSTKGISVFTLIELSVNTNKPTTSVARELLAAGFHERVRDFCRNQDHHLALSDNHAVVVLNAITKTSQLHLAATKLQRHFEAPVSIVDEEIALVCRTAFVIPTAKVTTPEKLMEAAERSLTLNAEKPYTIHKIGDNLAPSTPELSSKELMRALDNRCFELVANRILHANYGSVLGYQTHIAWTSDDWEQVTSIAQNIQPDIQDALCTYHLRAAANYLATMPENLYLEIEVTPEQVNSVNFVATLSDACGFNDLSSGRVSLALGSTHGFTQPGALEEVTEAGFSISLKNFGVSTNIIDILNLPCKVIETGTLPKTALHQSLAQMIHDLGKQAHVQIPEDQWAASASEWVKNSNYDAVILTQT